MAINQLSATGLTVQGVSDIVLDLTTGFTTVYGPSVNLESNTPDGQMINIFATALADNLDLLLSVYNQFSLTNAFGVQVDNLVALNGIQRQAGTQTVTYVNVTVSAALTLPGLDVLAANPNATVFTLADSAGNQYQLTSSYTFAGAGTACLSFTAVPVGQTLVSANTITTIITPLTSVTSVNNPAFSLSQNGTVQSGSAIITGLGNTTGIEPGMLVTDVDSFFPPNTVVQSVNSNSQITVNNAATGGSPTTESVTVATPPTIVGANEESDVQLKVRQAQSLQVGSIGPADAVRAQLLNIPGMADAFVPENDTGSIVSGVPANGIWVIVNAGASVTPAQIAQAIYAKKTAGCAQKTSAGQSFTITRPAGNTFTAYWDNAIAESLYISFTINPINGVDTFSATALAASLATALVYKLNQSAFVGQIIAAVQALAPNGFLTSIAVGSAPSPSAQQVSPSDFQHYFTVAAANIVITVA